MRVKTLQTAQNTLSWTPQEGVYLLPAEDAGTVYLLWIIFQQSLYQRVFLAASGIFFFLNK